MRKTQVLPGACVALLLTGVRAGAGELADEAWPPQSPLLFPRVTGLAAALAAAPASPQALELRPGSAPLVIRSNAQGRFASMRLSLFGTTGVFLNRLDARCNGELAARCSLYSLAFGVHGTSANLQWRVDGARALVPDHEFAHDAVHVRFQATYSFD